MKLSVLMSVYHKEQPDFLRQSLDSLVAQSVEADEVVIVKDGPVGDSLEAVIASYKERLPIVALQLKENVGLGPALRAGLCECRGELVARMDSDDICLPERFEKQLAVLEAKPSVDVVGGAAAEFINDFRVIGAVRRLPCAAEQLKRFAKFRNPLNHMTVMFRRSAVLAVGGYRPFPGLEDYDLWARMLVRGMELRNLDEVLVLVRCGNGMIHKRGSVQYAKEEIRLYRHFLAIGFISLPEFAFNILARAPVRIMPASLRSIVYKTLLRQEPR
jgi:O104-antigen biosynthesis beta-1,3-galactosyltransferase